MRMGAALGNIQTALLTSGAKCWSSALSQGPITLLVSKGYCEANYGEKEKKMQWSLFFWCLI